MDQAALVSLDLERGRGVVEVLDRTELKVAVALLGKPSEAAEHLNDAARLCHEALGMTPDAVGQLAAIQNQLGIIYLNAKDPERGMHPYRESIRLEEAQGHQYGAAVTRFNVAIALARAGRFADAREYAEAALRGFDPYGAGAADYGPKDARPHRLHRQSRRRAMRALPCLPRRLGTGHPLIVRRLKACGRGFV
jgi:tetratricopeptide (TPR) repeat protein